MSPIRQNLPGALVPHQNQSTNGGLLPAHTTALPVAMPHLLQPRGGQPGAGSTPELVPSHHRSHPRVPVSEQPGSVLRHGIFCSLWTEFPRIKRLPSDMTPEYQAEIGCRAKVSRPCAHQHLGTVSHPRGHAVNTSKHWSGLSTQPPTTDVLESASDQRQPLPSQCPMTWKLDFHIAIGLRFLRPASKCPPFWIQVLILTPDLLPVLPLGLLPSLAVGAPPGSQG